MTSDSPVVAAGALCWRVVDDTLLLLVIEREGHRDLSLPKGKVEPGELPPQTAVRELREETGLPVVLEAPLEPSRYRLPSGRPKVVHYWSAEVPAEDAERPFEPNSEVARLHWMTAPEARERLSYPHDARIVEQFEERYRAGLARTRALAIARHAKAVSRGDWSGADALRPLAPQGRRQAAQLAPALAGFGIQRIISSDAERCLATVYPLSAAVGREIKETPLISQDAFEEGDADIPRTVDRVFAKRKGAILCSHGPVLPPLIDEVLDRLELLPGTGRTIRRDLSTGSLNLLHIAEREDRLILVADEFIAPNV